MILYLYKNRIMDKYVLKNKTGEIISYIKANTISEARALFADIKKLEVEVLLRIFLVEEVN